MIIVIAIFIKCVTASFLAKLALRHFFSLLTFYNSFSFSFCTNIEIPFPSAKRAKKGTIEMSMPAYSSNFKLMVSDANVTLFGKLCDTLYSTV